MTDLEPSRTLILLRHGTAESAPGLPDAQRPLTARGRREAALAGGWIEQHQPPVAVILCSTAVRARQTAAESGVAAPTRYEERIYAADPDLLLDVLRDLDDQLGTVLLVGHAPGLPKLAGMLAGSGSAVAALDRLREGFPPAAVAVLSVTGGWWGIGAGRCTLLDVVAQPAG